MNHALNLRLLLELLLLVSACRASDQLEGLNTPSVSTKSGPSSELPEFKRVSHQRALQLQGLQQPDRNKCPRFCQEQGQEAATFQFCTSYCEPCLYVGLDDDLCLQITGEYEYLANSTAPWLISTSDDTNATLCPLYFTAGPYWYDSDPYLNLQRVRIVSSYKNNFRENQTIVGHSFQIWTQNRRQLGNGRPYVPPVSFEEDVDGLVVEPGQTVRLGKTVDLSDAPRFHDTISMRVYTIPRGFSPLGFNLTSAQITCSDGTEEEEQPLREPTIVCPNTFVAAPWGFDSGPPFQNIRAIELSADYQNKLNQSQTIYANWMQVWTASTNKENYDLPPITFDRNPDGWVVEPGEIVTVSFTADLRDTPAYHSIISIRMATFESGPTLPSDMAIVSSTIVCVS